MRPGTYADAGVDIAAQERTLELIRQAVRSTYTPAVITDMGSFGGIWALDVAEQPRPHLVASIDSVGTKVMVAAAAGRHRGIGYDIVHHCVNDIAVMGAEPLFFLDYYGAARLQPEVAAEVIGGLTEACRGVGCALLGGELAELPGMYRGDGYDLVGCIVGLLDPADLIDGRHVAEGDVILGLASSGLHTNGYSLARRVLLGEDGPGLDAVVPGDGRSVAEVLLEPHRCYLEPLRTLRRAGLLRAAAHITGGGVFDNLPRVLPAGLGAEIERGSWEEPPIFGWIARLGQVAPEEMFHTFNMGLGMLVVVGADRAAEAVDLLAGGDIAVGTVGRVVTAFDGVRIVEAGRRTPICR